MFTNLQIKLAVAALILAVLGGLGYFGYRGVYERGAEAAKIECQARFDKYQKEVDAKVATLEGNLAILNATNLQQQLALSTDIGEILKRVKKAPVTVVKNGTCYPSPTFVEGINQAIDRANQK